MRESVAGSFDQRAELLLLDKSCISLPLLLVAASRFTFFFSPLSSGPCCLIILSHRLEGDSDAICSWHVRCSERRPFERGLLLCCPLCFSLFPGRFPLPVGMSHLLCHRCNHNKRKAMSRFGNGVSSPKASSRTNGCRFSDSFLPVELAHSSFILRSLKPNSLIHSSIAQNVQERETSSNHKPANETEPKPSVSPTSPPATTYFDVTFKIASSSTETPTAPGSGT
jgi:hypothetical protein